MLQLDLQDQDTAVRKRNRDAQRMHRERKRTGAGGAANSNGNRQQMPTRAANDRVQYRPEASTAVGHDSMNVCSSIPFNPNGNVFAPMDTDEASDGSWSSNGIVPPGALDPAAPACTMVPVSQPQDPFMNQLFNFNQTVDPQQTTWSQGPPQSLPGPLNGVGANQASEAANVRPRPSKQATNISTTSEEPDRPGRVREKPHFQPRRDSSGDSTYFTKPSKEGGDDDPFASILEAVDAAGFHSFDEMVAAYYTVAADDFASLHGAQQYSRERELKQLLRALSSSAPDWTDRQYWSYQDEILKSARKVLSNELPASGHNTPRRPSLSVKSLPSPVSARSGNNSMTAICEGFQNLLHDEKVFDQLKGETTSLRNTHPETWEFMSRLAQSASISQPLNAYLVGVFLHVLVNGGS